MLRPSMIAILGAATAAVAQTPNPRIEQVQAGSAQERETLGITQVGTRSTEVPAVDPASALPRPPAQLSSKDDGRRTPVQLTSEPRTSEAAPQTYRGKTAREPEALSKPSEGRTGEVTRVEGNDRCDPDAAGSRSAACARVIETRAAEFTRPDPLRLSPEQRLLVDQRVREGSTTRLAAKRADEEELDPEASQGQAVAAMAFARQERDEALRAPTPALPQLPDASAAVIDALMQGAGTQAPR